VRVDVCAGRVRTKTTKRSARIMVEKYYSRLTVDFQVNKRVCDEIAIIPTKRLRNKIAGYVTVRGPFSPAPLTERCCRRAGAGG
jgi:ribosomal protein S17E